MLVSQKIIWEKEDISIDFHVKMLNLTPKINKHLYSLDYTFFSSQIDLIFFLTAFFYLFCKQTAC